MDQIIIYGLWNNMLYRRGLNKNSFMITLINNESNYDLRWGYNYEYINDVNVNFIN